MTSVLTFSVHVRQTLAFHCIFLCLLLQVGGIVGHHGGQTLSVDAPDGLVGRGRGPDDLVVGVAKMPGKVDGNGVHPSTELTLVC